MSECARIKASTVRMRKYRRARAYGTWKPSLVLADPVRQHARKLKDGGMRFRQICDAANVPHSSMSQLIYGYYDGRGPQKWINRDTAERILAVTLKVEPVTRRSLVDATGTRRRVQALCAIGWPQRQQALRVGMAPQNFHRAVNSSQVFAGTAQAVSDLYDELWDCPPPSSREKTRTLRLARESGYAPPLCWDDDELDDPNATPRGYLGRAA